MNHLERLQAAIIGRVFLHPQFCQDAERIANLWMAEWQCFRSFRLSAVQPNEIETKLSKNYFNWFQVFVWREDISTSSNLDRLSLNISMLETLPEEMQNVISDYLLKKSELFKQPYLAWLSQAIPT